MNLGFASQETTKKVLSISDIGFLAQTVSPNSQPTHILDELLESDTPAARRPKVAQAPSDSNVDDAKGGDGGVADEKHYCEYCPLSYKQRKDLNKHLRVKHPQEY